jgi:hypothetical protein
VNDVHDRWTSWAVATWSVPLAMLVWFVTALLVGLAVPDIGQTAFFVVTALLAVVMTLGGAVLARRGGGPAIRGAGSGMMWGGLACTLVAVVVVAQ